MANSIFNSMELDAIGEVMNISLGSSATAISNMLDHRVEITTPKVSITDVNDFTLGDLQPAVGVEIRYVSGLEGSNIMLLKRSDVKVIADILMGSETPEEEFELNDLNISAVCEVMNQMMGAASTALSEFLGCPVNISTPESFELKDFEGFKREHFPQEEGKCVVVHFTLNIENVLKSEFINVMSVKLARELLSGLGVSTEEGKNSGEAQQAPGQPSADNGSALSQEEVERLMNSTPNQPDSQAQSQAGGGKLNQEEIERLMNSAQSQPAPQEQSQAGGRKLSQEEIEQLMNSAQSQPAPQGQNQADGGKLSQEEIEQLMSSAQSQPASQGQNQAGRRKLSQEEIEQLMNSTQSQPVPQGQRISNSSQTQPGKIPQMQQAPAPGAYPYPPYGQYMPGYYPPPGYYSPAPPEPKKINAKPAEIPHLSNGEVLTEQQNENLDLLMSVPLEVSVEIGRTHKKVQDILAFSKGSLVVLNKLAGDQVDLFVNGQCVARGDVVVVDDNFGVRITEILKSPDPSELVHG
ncbi:MAG: flagellar motor switch protein FliN [Intestinimonas sp.]|jgi:flagellar motor switch protein FliN/FliY|nr:flagellar motor switch protein FliN [Intestinimonas sp.]